MNAHILNLARRTLVAAFLAIPGLAMANPVLTVTNGDTSTTYTFDELSEMPQTTLLTKNDYLDKAVELTGPKLRELLERANIGANETLVMNAINDYTVNVPAADAYKYNVILAILNDGERMSVRDKGPIWVIYPIEELEGHSQDAINHRMVWQLQSITVE